MTVPNRAGRPTPIPPGALVLGRRPLAAGCRRRDTSRFADDRWDLAPALHTNHKGSLSMDFTTVPPGFRPVVKELLYALLVIDLPDGEDEQRVESVRGLLSSLMMFLTWADGLGHRSLAGIPLEELRKYPGSKAVMGLTLPTRRYRLRSARMFWIYRSKLTADGFVGDPGDLKEWKLPSRDRSAENATERIPEQVVAPLLIWSLRWIDDFADDVLEAVREWERLNAEGGMNRIRRGAAPARDLDARLRGLLDGYRALGRPLPGSAAGNVNHAHLARELGCAPGSLIRAARPPRLIAEAAEELGIAGGTFLRTPVRALVDGRPWHGPIEYTQVPVLASLLQAAASILTLYLSGMRDSEVKHLEAGCLSRRLRADGSVHRRRVRSLAFKGEDDVRGVPATWVVSEAVDRALAVLERLHDGGNGYLFALPPTSRAILRGHRNEAMTNATTNRGIRSFMDWINDFCREHDRSDGIPLVRGSRVSVTTSQFRRTLAWHIARRPGGVIAGAIAYRHAGVQMFEGYAGTSESGFRAEVEAEVAITQSERLGEMVTTSGHRRLTGPAAAEAEARLDEFARHVVFEGKVVTDRKRLQRILDRHQPHVYFGKFVTCVHNRDRALCRRDDDSEGPNLHGCVPLRCRNVALTRDNRAAVVEHLAELDARLDNPDRWAPLVLTRLREERSEVAAFLDRNP
jgi:integrase